jgi:hypothetical protein
MLVYCLQGQPVMTARTSSDGVCTHLLHIEWIKPRTKRLALQEGLNMASLRL